MKRQTLFWPLVAPALLYWLAERRFAIETAAEKMDATALHPSPAT